MSYSLVVFDWDGTLMDSTHTIVAAIQASCRDLELPEPSVSEASWVIGLSLESALLRAVPKLTPALLPRFLERYRVHYLLRDPEIKLFDGTLELLEALSARGVKLAVATGKSRVGLNRAMNTTGLLNAFDATRCADETFSKPHPAMLQELTRELGQDLQRTVMIGDTTHDLQMAINAGARGVAVEFGAHPAQQLQALAPLYSAKSIRELHQWLTEHA